MNSLLLNKIWTIIATAACYFSINIFIITQGGHFLLPGLKLEDIHPRAAAVYGTWFAVPLIIVTLILIIIFAHRQADQRCLSRFPVAFGPKLDFDDWLARCYQGFFFIAYVVAPIYAAVHFLRKTLNGPVIDKNNANQIVADTPWEHLTIYKPFTEIFTDGNRYRFENDITFFPFWQPWLGLLLTLVCVCLFVTVVYLLIRETSHH